MGVIKLNKMASMGTAVFSAVSLKLCCWGPLFLTGVVGISGSSVYFSWLTALKPYLLAIAFLSLGFAFLQIYKKKEGADCERCENKKPFFFKSKFSVWPVTIFVVVMTLVSYFPEVFYQPVKKQILAIDKSDIQTVKLGIEGMVCTGCEETINRSVNQLAGILSIKTYHQARTSEIEFDKTKANIDKIKEVISSRGYLIKHVEYE